MVQCPAGNGGVGGGGGGADPAAVFKNPGIGGGGGGDGAGGVVSSGAYIAWLEHMFPDSQHFEGTFRFVAFESQHFDMPVGYVVSFRSE